MTEEERIAMRDQWLAANPMKSIRDMPARFQDGAPTMKAKVDTKALNLSKVDNAGADGFASNPDMGSYKPSPANMPAPSEYILAAMAKPAKDRTPQEASALQIRRNAEEITTKQGGKVQNGVTPMLIAETKGAEQGRFEAKAGIAYNRAKNDELKSAGFNADGATLDPSTVTPAVSTSKAKPTSGGTMTRGGETVKVEGSGFASDVGGNPSSGGNMPSMRGFAMRKMADGTVRTAGGVDASGRSIMRDFGSEAEAMGYYRPAAPAQNMAQGQPGAQPAPQAQTAQTQPQAPAQAQAPAAQPTPKPAPKQEFSALTPDASVFAAGTPSFTGADRDPALNQKRAVEAAKGVGAVGVEMAKAFKQDVNVAGQKIGGALSTVADFGNTLMDAWNPTKWQNPAAARTTSPTMRLQMANKEMGAPRTVGKQVMGEKLLNPFATQL